MKPFDFIQLAKSLLIDGGEVELRSAVSRGYYGAFHVACELVESCGVNLPKSAAAHEKVTYCLQNSLEPQLILAGLKLNSLRAIRNAADYRLDDKRFLDLKQATVSIGIVQEIVDVLINLEKRHDEIRLPIRRYAQSQLGLILRDEP